MAGREGESTSEQEPGIAPWCLGHTWYFFIFLNSVRSGSDSCHHQQLEIWCQLWSLSPGRSLRTPGCLTTLVFSSKAGCLALTFLSAKHFNPPLSRNYLPPIWQHWLTVVGGIVLPMEGRGWNNNNNETDSFAMLQSSLQTLVDAASNGALQWWDPPSSPAPSSVRLWGTQASVGTSSLGLASGVICEKPMPWLPWRWCWCPCDPCFLLGF